jgi:hypothetical protein
VTFQLEDTFALLERTPGALREQLVGLPVAWTESRPDPENWSAYQVVCHLAYIEENDWLVRARLILERGPTQAFPPVDHGDQSARSLLTDAGVLDRRGLHPTLGEVTMRQLLATWVVHDLNHLRQAQEAMAVRYSADVGPWKANLGILS